MKNTIIAIMAVASACAVQAYCLYDFQNNTARIRTEKATRDRDIRSEAFRDLRKVKEDRVSYAMARIQQLKQEAENYVREYNQIIDLADTTFSDDPAWRDKALDALEEKYHSKPAGVFLSLTLGPSGSVVGWVANEAAYEASLDLDELFSYKGIVDDMKSDLDWSQHRMDYEIKSEERTLCECMGGSWELPVNFDWGAADGDPDNWPEFILLNGSCVLP